MKTTKFKGNPIRLVLAGMITDPSVLATVGNQWDDETGLFNSRWANLVGGWCVKWHRRYGTAPNSNIQDQFNRWASKQKDDDTVELVGKFMSYMSEEYTQRPKADRNTQYLIDQAGEYFEKASLKRLNQTIEEELELGNTDSVKKLITDFALPNLGRGAYADVTDQTAWEDAFNYEEEALITYPGSLGKFFGTELGRDAFVAFMGPEKRGKTWWLMDVAWMGMLQRKRVAFFNVGDLSQNQSYRRFGIRAAQHPKRAGTVKVPTAMHLPDVEFEERVFDVDLDWRKAWASMQKIMKHKVKSEQPYLRVSTHPNSSITAMGIYSILQDWARLGWIADVVAIDYADILASPVGGGADDARAGINANWKAMRRISQELHCLVVTATQADAASYNRETIGRDNFSEDKRKIAHVTGMMGINQTDEEKENGVQRLNWLARRDDFYIEKDVVHCAGCLSLGRPVVHSTFH